MLKVFRDNLKNLAWILWVVIILFVLALAVEFGGNVQGQAGQDVAATVGGDRVTVTEFQRAYQNLDGLYRQIYGEQFTPELARQMQLPLQALDRAVNQKIMLAEARRLGLGVSDEELRKRILEIPGLKDEQGSFIGQEEYVQRLSANRVNVADFERELREELLLQKLEEAMTANLYVSEEEVRKAYRDQVERAKIRYLQLPRSRFAQEVRVQPGELATYFNSHKSELRLPEQREAAYLLLESGRLASQVNLTDAELQAWYNSHKAEFTQEEQVHARHVLVMVNDQRTDAAALQRIEEAKQRIQGGADFAAVAREVSDDSASKAIGGDLGFFGRNRMVKEFEAAAFGAQPGQLVGPVRSSFGYHLIQVIDKRPAGQQTFAQAKEMIRARLTAERTRELAETRAKELASRLKKDKPGSAEGLRALAQPAGGITFAETGKFGQQDPIPALGFNPAFSTAAFSLKKGDVSDAIQLPQGWAVLYLKEVHATRTPELTDVEARVRQAVEAQKQQQLAMAKLQQARQQLGAGKTLDMVAAELGIGVKETPEFGGEGTVPGIGYNPDLARAALSLPAGQTGGPVADSQGALLFQVTERKSWDPKQYSSNREQTRSTLLREKLNRLQAALVEQRRRDLGVEYDRQLLESLDITPPQQS